MSNADRSYDLTNRQLATGDLAELLNGRVPLDAFARTASKGLERPTLHLWVPPSNSVAVYVGSLDFSRDLLFPAVLTWEFYVGGRGRLDGAPLFQRKTRLDSASAVASRLGMLVSFEGPLFHQLLLVTRLGETVNGVTQPGHVTGTIDLTHVMSGRIGALRVQSGPAVG